MLTRVEPLASSEIFTGFSRRAKKRVVATRCSRPSCCRGGGPPPHIHRKEDETFYILEGEITFQIGGERRVAGPGTFVHMPIGNLHAFKNETDQPVKMLVSFVPAGLEEMFFRVGKDLADGELPEEPSPQEVDRLLEIAGRYGIEYHLSPH